MNIFAVFGVLVIFASLSWNVDCAPQHYYSESSSSSSSNGRPTMTRRVINNNGQREVFINGRHVSESEIGDQFERDIPSFGMPNLNRRIPSSSSSFDWINRPDSEMGIGMERWPMFNSIDSMPRYNQRFPSSSFGRYSGSNNDRFGDSFGANSINQI